MHVVYLHPRTSYRTELRSDTLWGLMIVAIRTVLSDQRASEVVNASERGEPPFIVSSAMPYSTQNGAKLHYFPRPILKPSPKQFSKREELQAAKRIKKIRTLPQNTWEKLICGEISQKELEELLNSETAVSQTVAYTLHVAIDRLTNSALQLHGRGQLYYSEDRYLPQHSGLFFLIEGDMSVVEPALRFLQHYGFGGDASVGKGVFDVEIVPNFPLRTPSAPTHFTTLSLYTPTETEFHHLANRREEVWYELVSRRGRVGTHFTGGKNYEKRPVVAFSEGSTFPILQQSRFGRTQPVMNVNGIVIQFNGFAFAIPARWKEDS